MEMRTFKVVNKSRNAFWKISEPWQDWTQSKDNRWVITVHYGKNGTKGSVREKFFDSKHEAKNYYIKIISQKYVKGYVEQDGGVQVSKPVTKPKPFLQGGYIDHYEDDDWATVLSVGEVKKPVHILPPIEQKKKRRMKLGGIKSAARA